MAFLKRAALKKLTAGAVHGRDDGLRAALECRKCLLQREQVLALVEKLPGDVARGRVAAAEVGRGRVLEVEPDREVLAVRDEHDGANGRVLVLVVVVVVVVVVVMVVGGGGRVKECRR